MYRRRFHFLVPFEQLWPAVAAREVHSSRPARIRVVDAPFPIAISAPSLELGNPHGSRCGHALANAGQDTRALQAWLGHKNIQHTVRYTELAADRFKGTSNNAGSTRDGN